MISEFYHNIIQSNRIKLQESKKKLLAIQFSRVFFFAGFLITLILSLSNSVNYIYFSIFSFLGFILLIKAFRMSENRSEFFKRVDDVTQREIQIVKNEIPPTKIPEKSIHKNHAFAFDLDVFGNNSLFSRLNRTTSQISENILVDSLTKLSSDQNNIYKRQESISELSQNPSKIIEFNAIALQYFDCQSEVNQIHHALTNRSRRVSLFFVFISLGLSLGAIASLVLAISQEVPHTYWIFLFAINLIITYFIKEKKSDITLSNDKSYFILKKYQELADHLNDFDFKTEHLKILSANCKKFSSDLIKLMSILNFQKSSSFITNGFFQLDVHVIRKINSIKTQSAIDFGNLVSDICQIEELISIAFFKFNNPSYTFPKITGEQGVLNFRDIGHPFVLRENCVNNDLYQEGKVNIITGSNMSGKSTFLRSIGMNFVLAHIGAPVFASHFETSLGNLFTSIKTVDSLNEQKSFFYAEILRLAEIQKNITEGSWALVLLDETLKGTNSEDKLNGSISLAIKFSKLNCTLFFATHDSKMGVLEDQNKSIFSNYCFESEVLRNEIAYDFKLRKGVTKSKNATFLLKSLGVID